MTLSVYMRIDTNCNLWFGICQKRNCNYKIMFQEKKKKRGTSIEIFKKCKSFHYFVRTTLIRRSWISGSLAIRNFQNKKKTLTIRQNDFQFIQRWKVIIFTWLIVQFDFWSVVIVCKTKSLSVVNFFASKCSWCLLFVGLGCTFVPFLKLFLDLHTVVLWRNVVDLFEISS